MKAEAHLAGPDGAPSVCAAVTRAIPGDEQMVSSGRSAQLRYSPAPPCVKPSRAIYPPMSRQPIAKRGVGVVRLSSYDAGLCMAGAFQTILAFYRRMLFWGLAHPSSDFSMRHLPYILVIQHGCGLWYVERPRKAMTGKMMCNAAELNPGKGDLRRKIFPVESRSFHLRHRGIILGFNRFARADDIADHPSAGVEEKLAFPTRCGEPFLGYSTDTVFDAVSLSHDAGRAASPLSILSTCSKPFAATSASCATATGTTSWATAPTRRCRSGVSCSMFTGNPVQHGRPAMRYAPRSRSSIICRIAPLITAISTASTFRSMP